MEGGREGVLSEQEGFQENGRSIGVFFVLVLGRGDAHPGAAYADAEEDVEHWAAEAGCSVGGCVSR